MPKVAANPKPAKPASKSHWLVVNQSGDVTEMVISGIIGSSWYDDSGSTSKEFREKFNAIPKGNKVRVRINSEGGSVQDALEMYNLMQARKEDVTCCVDGYALSSASIVALGGGRTIAPHSSIFMVHEPWSMTVGNENDHLKAAEMLATHGDTIASIYAKKTGKPAGEWRAKMRDESWYSGAEAVTAGLADAIEEEESAAEEEAEENEEASNRFAALNLESFKNIPSHIFNMLRPKPQAAAQPPPSAPVPGSGDSAPRKGNKTTDDNTMNKKAIMALLKTRGVELAEDSTEEQVLAALEKLGTTPANAANPADAEQAQKIVDLTNQLQGERKIRITSEVKRRAENKISNEKLNWWIDLAVKDEVGTLAQIDSLPVNRPGGEPVGHEIGSIVENRLEAIKKEPVARKRFAVLKDEWSGLIQDAVARDARQRMAPMMANSYSGSLVTQFLLDGAVTKLQNRWAPLKVFSKDYSTDRYKPLATGQLKYVTAGATTQTNATNFEDISSYGNSTVTNTQIAVSQYTQGFHVSNSELNSGLRMENLIDVNIAYLADKILYVAFAPLATASFTSNAAITRAATAFAFSDMATAWGELKKSPTKYAVLDGEYMARIINSPVFYQAAGTDSGADGWSRFGWDGVFLNTNWLGHHSGSADQYIRGLFCNPQCLGAIAGLPLIPPTIPGATLQESSITIPDVDISVASFSWFSLQTRSLWMSYDLMFGSALLDESAGVLLTSQ